VSTPTSSTDAAGLMELDKDSFQAYIDAAGDKLVVVDFFTDVSGFLRRANVTFVSMSVDSITNVSRCRISWCQHRCVYAHLYLCDGWVMGFQSCSCKQRRHKIGGFSACWVCYVVACQRGVIIAQLPHPSAQRY
jgi:hypothetical protein